MSRTLSKPDLVTVVAATRPVAAHLPVAVFALAAFKVAVTLAFSNQYGFHRDELYYLASARHPAWGYVDYPPITPILARLDMFLFGTHLVTLRLLPILAGTIIVILAAMIARELGGCRRAEILAAFLVTIGGIYLGGDWLFETVAFDQLARAITIFFLVRLLRTGNLRLWIPVGISLGVGLETKYTIAGFAVALLIGLMLTPARAQLKTPWPWIAAVIALVIMAPNLVWQVQHDWPSASYLLFHHGRIGQDTSRVDYIVQQIVLSNILGFPILILGFRELWRRVTFRCLAWTAMFIELIFLLGGGKSYYASPIFVLLFAAGALPLERYMSSGPTGRRLALIVGSLALVTVVLSPVALPILPAQAMKDAKLYKVRDDYANMIGWPEFVREVANAYNGLPPRDRRDARILVGNYGEAGAIDLYGSQYHLPPALSGHLTYYYWKPQHVVVKFLVLVNVDPSSLGGQCTSTSRVGTITNDLKLDNEEYGDPILLCKGPAINLDRVWKAQQHFD